MIAATFLEIIERDLGKFMEEVTVVFTAHGAEHVGARELRAIQQRLLSYARKEIKPPETHDLQKAFYLSFLRSTEMMYLARLEQLGWKLPTVSWKTGLTHHVLGKLRPSSITTLSLGPKAEKPALIESLGKLRDEIAACADISPAELENRLPLRPNIAVLNQLTFEGQSRGSEAIGNHLVGVLIHGSRWYAGLLTLAFR